MTPISAASAPGRAPGAVGEVIRPSSLRSRRRRTVGRYTLACKSCADFRPAKPNGYAPASRPEPPSSAIVANGFAVLRSSRASSTSDSPSPPRRPRPCPIVFSNWLRLDGKRELVYPLEHAYTPVELGFTALKGADAAVAGVLTTAAQQARCDLHLALLTVQESGAAEYSESYGSRRGRWGRGDVEENEFEAGEVLNQYMTLSNWHRPDSSASPLGDIPVDAEEVSPPDACDDLVPDEEHFHEATGNEGASFERTYRRAALVLWPSERTFAVLSQAGLPVTLPYLDDLTHRWAGSAGDQQSCLWREAHDLASHMLAQWPTQNWYPRRDKAPSDATRMLTLLTRLDDTALIERFLTEVTAAGHYDKGDNAAILDALDHLPPGRAKTLIERIVAGTATTAPGARAALLSRAAAPWGAGRGAALGGAAPPPGLGRAGAPP